MKKIIYISTLLLIAFNSSCQNTKIEKPIKINDSLYRNILIREILSKDDNNDNVIFGLRFGITKNELEDILRRLDSNLICDSSSYNFQTTILDEIMNVNLYVDFDSIDRKIKHYRVYLSLEDRNISSNLNTELFEYFVSIYGSKCYIIESNPYYIEWILGKKNISLAYNEGYVGPHLYFSLYKNGTDNGTYKWKCEDNW